MDSLIPVVMIFTGIVVGAVVVWLLLRGQSQRSYENGQADSATQVAALHERLAARDQEVQKLQHSFEKEVSERERVRDTNADLRAQLEGERRAAQERSESFKQAAEELSEKFKALSRDALKDNNQSFLDLARATLEKFQTGAKGDLELRQRAIDQLVKPLKES
ncbi:MAG: recombination protein RmuC, partial [Blastocatellia bacterium]|nr:recombination protein RmuC [Blastocatellia bacterium]